MTDLRPASGRSVDRAAPGRDRVLDGYRAAAALAVLVTHVSFQTGAVNAGTLGALAARLDLGVALFFVLSGFVLYGSYARSLLTGSTLPSSRRYLRHRALRILPAYWVVIVVVLATVGRAGHGLADLVRHVFLLQTFSPGQLLGDLTQTWSLATEVCFYLFLPLYAGVLTWLLARVPVDDCGARLRVQVGGLGVLLVVSPLWTWLVLGLGHLDPRVAMLWLPAHLDWFAAGMLVALLREYDHITGHRASPWRTLASAPGACWAAAGALLLVASTPVAGPLTLEATTALHAATKELAYLVVATLILVAGVWPVAGSVSEGIFTARPVQAVGRWSYGLFLWHLLALDLVLRLLHRAPFSGGFWLVLPLTIGLGCAFAAASWVLVERPLRRFREPRSSRQEHRSEQRAGGG